MKEIAQHSSPKSRQTIVLINVSTYTGNQLSVALGGIFRLVLSTLDSETSSRISEVEPKAVLIELEQPELRKFDRYTDLVRVCKERNIPIIVILDHENVEQMASGYYLGISDYLTRPIIPAEALVRLAGQLELAASSRAIEYVGPKAIPDAKSDGGSILLADDNYESINALAELLKERYSVTVATNGRDALREIQSKAFDLVILDVVMPDLNGYEVCEAIKSDPLTEHIPVIFLTGQGETDSESYGFSIGAADYIHKPAVFNIVKSRISQHLSVARKISTLTEISYLDALTKLPNRHKFEEHYDLEFKRARRSGSILSVLMIDVDQFKLFNDHYGHASGDECLKKVGRTLSEFQIRPGDFTARIGGEEFVTLLPNTDLNGAKVFAEKLNNAIEELKIEQAPKAEFPFVTLSIGIATAKISSDSRKEELLEKADLMLYDAKRKGRNQVSGYSVSDATGKVGELVASSD